jgi:hypothetical protein
MNWKVKVVIHDEYGGFSLTEEMVNRLKKRGCKWADKCGKAHGSNPHYYLPYDDDDRGVYRKDPDLVAVVEELLAEYEAKTNSDESLPWREQVQLSRSMTANLKVVEVTVSIEINDHDGRESVKVHGGVW